MRRRHSSLDGPGILPKLTIGIAVLLLLGFAGLLVYGSGVEPGVQTYERTLPDDSFAQ